jgi:hypothetical protein
MSSMETTINLSNSGMNTEFMRYIKCAGALVNPNDKKIFIKLVSRRESCHGDIFSTNLNLMIAGAEINFGTNLNLMIAGAEINFGERLGSR